MNRQQATNTSTLRGPQLERALLAKLADILGAINWLTVLSSQKPARAEGPDAAIRLTSDVGEASLHVHVKSQMRPSTFPTWAAAGNTEAAERHAVPVLAMPHVSTRLAELCHEARWSWFDLSGNCRLDVPGQLHIERTGYAPRFRPPRPSANLGSPAAARVMRVLLSPDHAGNHWTQRDLQTYTAWNVPGGEGVSLGLVNKVVRYLRDGGFVSKTEERRTSVKDPIGLLRAWSDAYRFDQHERLSYFTLLKRKPLEKALYQIGLKSGGFASYAAFSAAEHQAPMVRQPKTWLYVAAEFIDSLEEDAQAKKVDSGENLVVLIPEDSGVFLSFSGDRSDGDERMGCTDPAQTYVDLMKCGGRGEEAAQAVLEQRILPAWKAQGLA